MADDGSDFAGIDDVDANLSRVAGRTAHAQALARRYSCPAGGLFYASGEYGKNLADLVSAGGAPTRHRASIEAQALQDERTQSAHATVEWNEATEESEISIEVFDSDGPFLLNANPADLTFEILENP
ncbi:MAG: hypothetical protein AMXMBFR56_76950 [Polyangiaceae bacterium]